MNERRAQSRRRRERRGTKVLRQCAYALAGVLLLGAAALAGLRLLLPELEHYRPEIERWVSRVTEREVAFESIDAHWRGWTPVFRLNGVRLGGGGPAGAPATGDATDDAIRLASLSFSIDPLESLRSRALQPREVTASGASLTLLRRSDGSFSVKQLGELAPAGPGAGDRLAKWVVEPAAHLAVLVAHRLDRRAARHDRRAAERSDTASRSRRRPASRLGFVRASQGRPGRLRDGGGRRSAVFVVERLDIPRGQRCRCRPSRPRRRAVGSGGDLRRRLRNGVEHVDGRPVRRGAGDGSRPHPGRHARWGLADARRGERLVRGQAHPGGLDDRRARPRDRHTQRFVAPLARRREVDVAGRRWGRRRGAERGVRAHRGPRRADRHARRRHAGEPGAQRPAPGRPERCARRPPRLGAAGRPHRPRRCPCPRPVSPQRASDRRPGRSRSTRRTGGSRRTTGGW